MQYEYELLDKNSYHQHDKEESSSSSNTTTTTNSNPKRHSYRLLGMVLLSTMIWFCSLILVISFNKKNLSTIQEPALLHVPIFIPHLPSIPLPKPIWSDNIREINFDIEGSNIANNFTGLSQLCLNTKWNHNRWFTCDGIQGGIANVFNALLNCIRYTIEGGAGLKLPSIYLRGALENPAVNLHTGGRGELDYFFDIEHFKSILEQHCPQLILVDSIQLLPGFESATFSTPFRPRDIYTQATGIPADEFMDFNHHTNTFRKNFDKVHPESEEVLGTKIYRLAFALFDWDITNQDSSQFWRNFGRILKFRKDTRLLASEIYHNLLQLDDSSIREAQYFGAHLRSEKDSPPSWTNADQQMSQYISMTIDSSLSTIYVASGDPLEVIKFRKEAALKNLKVLGKEDLLSPLSKNYLESLTFDQGALIDYLIMLKSIKFAGIGPSSFSQSIASRRHLMGNQSRELMTHEGDEFSVLLDCLVAPVFRVTTWP